MSRPATKLTLLASIAVVVFSLSGCNEIQRPEPEAFYAESVPPAKQEFRWSNGGMPRTFDPARAAAAPETDLVRALFEGLTEIDTNTLEPVPAAAEKWSASDDQRVWTFHLRKSARWSNGKRVTSYDFVTSWKRLIALGDKAAHRELFQNIVGFQASKPIPTTEPPEPAHSPRFPIEKPVQQQPAATPTQQATTPDANLAARKPEAKASEQKLGVEALDDLTLRVTLVMPDPDLPVLVAASVFRPIYGDGSEFADGLLDNGVITNGAFTVALVDKNGISLDRSETYWNKAAVNLEHVRFVVKDSAEAALDAYRKGEIDALTNANLEPLALKLLAPYNDFRQTTFSAVNLYKFDATRPPFNDRRVREALAISVDRDRLANAELEGAVEPAGTLLAMGGEAGPLAFDPEKGRKLLESAGFPKGEGFAPIRLLINRNDTQLRVARAVARMWKQNLNLDTEINVKETTEIDAAEGSHEFDVVRHGVVLPTADEAVSMWAIFGTPKPAEHPLKPETKTGPLSEKAEKGGPEAPMAEPAPAEKAPTAPTEAEALFELHAIPLYFPRSYLLVKPYVHGFETNGLDTVYLPGVSIDSNWQPTTEKRES